jgi:hypothetical protein
MTKEQKQYHFAVGIDRPLVATLETYGVEDGVTYYVWLLDGQMQGLCCGLEEARTTAAGKGWAMHSFDGPEEAAAVARVRVANNVPFEAVSLYQVALMLAEHMHGEGSVSFRGICSEFALLCRNLGNEEFASALEGLSNSPSKVGTA